MAGELIDFGNRIGKLTDPAAMKRITLAAGMAGKKAVLDAASKDLGSDRAFSGFGRKVPLGAGFDEVTPTLIRINFRPPGLWKLAESGRRGGYKIRSRRRLGGEGSGHAPAILTPGGWRAAAVGGAWGGKGTFTAAVKDARREVPKAARKQFQREVAKVVK